MSMFKIKDESEYKRVKEALRNRFENERTGDQKLFTEQTKIFQPLINTQNETAKSIKDTVIDSHNVSNTAFTNALLPAIKSIENRNNQMELLMEQPYYNQEILPIKQSSPDIMKVDLDANLNETDIENLLDMSLELPSMVFKYKNIKETLDKIKTENRSIGQKLNKKTKLSDKEKEIYDSRSKTLKLYKEKILGLEGAKQFISTPKKSGFGLNTTIDVIYYHSADDLCLKLKELHIAKQAGNTGLDNKLNSILDELLRIKAICKNEYDELFNNIFI